VRAALARRPAVVLAVSGGLDSMTLLDATGHLPERGHLIVATFDHGTGRAATEACDLVEATADAMGIACTRGQSECALRSEAELRRARWAFLRRVADQSGAAVATAHTASDQVETVFMRVLRHAGPRGLAGLYAESGILRPLVALARDDIARYAVARRLAWIEDPSNASRAYLRNRVRLELLPALRRTRPTLDAELLDVARRAVEWRADVDAFLDRCVPIRVYGDVRGLDVDAAAMGAIGDGATAILWPAVLARAGVVLDRSGTERLARFAERARVGARIDLRGHWQVTRSRSAFQLRRAAAVAIETEGPTTANAAEPTLLPLALSNGTRWGDDWSFTWSDEPASLPSDDPWVAYLPNGCALLVRTWQPGDVMQLGAGHLRKVKQLLSQAGVTGHQRAGWPVVLANDQIVWIPGVRRSDAATARSGQPGLPFACAYFYRHLFR